MAITPVPFTARLAAFADNMLNGPLETKPAPAPNPAPVVDEATKLTQDLAQLRQATADADVMATVTLSQDRGNDLTADNQLLQEFDQLSPVQFQQKYGLGVYDQLAAVTIGGKHVRDLAATSRTLDEHLADGVAAVGGGAVGGILGVHNFAIRGMFAGELGERMLRGNEALSAASQEFFQSIKTDARKRQTYVSGVRQSLDAQDNDNAYQKDLDEGSKLVAELRAAGRGVLTGVEQVVEDPTLLEEGVASGVGSMLVGGPVSRVLGSGAKVVNTAVNPARARIANELIDDAVFPLTIAAMEGGGNAASAAQQVMDMPLEDLWAEPAFQQLVSDGMSVDDARRRIADRAGAMALSISAPVGALTGRLVEKLETAPFARTSPTGLAVNSGKEFIEEGIQSGVGELAGNIGQVVSGADADASLGQGVGEAAIQGALYGAGTPGVTQGPGVALTQAVKAAKLPFQALARRGERQMAANEAASSVSAETLAPLAEAAVAEAPAVGEAIRSMAEKSNATAPDLDAYINQVTEASQTSEEDLVGLPRDLLVRVAEKNNELGRMPNRFETLTLMAQVAADESASQEQRVGAGTTILKLVEKNRKLFEEDLPSFLDNIPHDWPEYQQFAAYQTVMRNIGSNKAVNQALDWAQTKMQMPDQDLTGIDLNSEQGQITLNQAVDVATLAPQAVNTNVANQILLQADEGTLSLTPERRRILRNAVALNDSARLYAAQNRAPEAIDLEDLGSELETTQVRDERIEFIGRQIETEGGKKAHQLSMQQHVTGINQSIAAGDDAGAKRKAQHLGRFARSMINKVNALNTAIRNGDRKRVPYQSLGNDGEWLPNDEYFSVFYNPGTEASEKLARKVHAEARAVAELANQFAGQFGFQKVQVPALVLDRADKQRGSASADSERVGATKPQPSEDKQLELPLPPTQPARDPEVKTSADEVNTPESTGSVGNTSTENTVELAKPVSDQDSKPVLELTPVVEAVPETVADQAVAEKPAPEDFESWGPRQLIAAIERTEAEQIKRQSLLSDPNAMEAYAKDRGITVDEMQALVSNNFEHNTTRLQTMRSISKSQSFLEAQATARRQASNIRFEEVLEADIEPDPAPRVLEDQSQAPQETLEVQQAVEREEIIDLLDNMTDADRGGLRMEEVFPTLVQPAGRNFFHKSFRLARDIKSRMLTLSKDPIQAFREMFQRPSLLEAHMAGQETAQLDRSDRDNLVRLMNAADLVMGFMTDRLAAEDAKEKISEKLNAGEEKFIRTRDLRVLNLLDKVGEDYRYNPALVQSAVIAGLDWALNVAERSAPLSRQDVAGLMGIDESEVHQNHIDAFNRGTSLDMAKRTLADNIMKFWGIEANKDARDGFTKGIPEALAAEVLYGLEAAGLIELGLKDKALRFAELSDKTFNRVWFDTRSNAVQEFVKSLDGVSDLLADMAIVDRKTDSYSIGQPVEDVDATQLRNPMVPTTKQQKQALENVQKTPYYPNDVVFDFVQAMGLEAFVTLMSGRTYTNGDLDKTHTDMGLNKAHWESVKGLQRQLVNSFNNVAKQMAQVKRRGDGTPTYYKHHINKLGRMQMAGLSNPQSDKLAREIFMATKSTLDLSERGSVDYNRFLVTIAQGIGVKTEKEYRAVAVKTVEDRALTEGGALRPLVLAMKAWSDRRGPMSQEILDMLTRADLSMHGMQSLLSLAQYENARDRGQDLSKFETFSYLEADGKTNGPINSMLLMAAGAITPEWLRQIAKGGAFFGRLGKTLNQHVKQDPKDLYEEGSDGTMRRMKARGESIQEDSEEAFKIFERFRYFLSALDANVSINDEGAIEIKRGLTKNPLTITIYGSGEKGIAGNVVDELLNVMYEKLSEGLERGVSAGDLIYGQGGSGIFGEHLSVLTSQTVKVNSETGKYVVRGKVQQVTGKPEDFELSPQQYKALRDNVLTFLVEPMVGAINDTVTGHVGETTKALQEATQVQSIILKGMFMREIAARIAKMQADREKYDYVNGEFLTQNEIQDIWNNLKVYAPIIHTGTQSYFLSGSERSDLFSIPNLDKDGNPVLDAEGNPTFIEIVIDGAKVVFPESFSRSITSDMSTPAFVNGPTLAGVGGIPTLVVGSGDGQMMLNFLGSNPEAAARVLHVFDGLNMPADAIDDYSKGINEAVFNTWTSNTNPIRAVADSFAEFLRNRPTENFFPGGESNPFQKQALLEISRSMLNKFKISTDELASEADVLPYMQGILQRLNDLADQIDVRRQVYAEFDFTVDQMASAENPFVNTGSIQLDPDASLDDIAQAMSDRYTDLLTELQSKRAGEQAVEKQSELIKASISEAGASDENGVRVVTAKELPGLFKSLTAQLNPTQKEMMRNAVRLLEGSDYKIVFGTPSQLDNWEEANNADRFIPGSNTHYGKTDPVAKIITVSSSSAETIVHELIHAATFDKVQAFYSNPDLLPKEEREAVARIEGLMNEWLQLSYEDDHTAGADARRKAEHAVVQHLDRNNKAGAVNEFMAWVLGNQHLAELAKKTKVKNPVFRIVGEMLASLKSLLWGGPTKGARVGDNLLSNLRFNTRVLMRNPSQVELLQQDFAAVALYQSPLFGTNDRLSQLRQRFENKIIAWINEGNSDPVIKIGRSRERQKEADDALANAQDIGKVFAFHFPSLGDMQAYSTFTTIQQALMTEVGLNTNALTRVEELYTHVIKEITADDFRDNQDPNDQQDKAWAQAKFNTLEGAMITKTDKHGRSSLMSSFLALAMVDDGFRKILAGMARPKSDRGEGTSLDTRLENLGNSMMDSLSIRAAGEKGANVQEALDSLMVSMIENVGDQRSYIEQRTESGFDKIENRLASAIQNGADRVIQATSKVLKSNRSAPVRAAAGLVNLTATMINEQAAEEAALGVTSWLNRRGGLQETSRLINEVIGRTRENFKVFDMISKVRAEVQQTRQQFRDELPKKLASMFKTPVTTSQWSAMYKALGKTDLAALAGRYGIKGAIEMVGSRTRLNSEIQTLERSIQVADPQRFARIKSKSQQLARFMMTGEHGTGLMRNAEAIARLLGDQTVSVLNAPSAQLVDDIDALTSLYAIQAVDLDTLDTVHRLINLEGEGVEFVTNYLVGQRVDEVAKAKKTTTALFNHYKGHIPSEAKQGGSLIIASDSEHARLVGLGYRQVSPYLGSSADRALTSKSYYFSPVSGTAPFSQGVMQTVHQTASGIDPDTGYTVGEVMAGRIEDIKIVRKIQQQIANQNQTNENLLPVFDDAGRVIAYERAADPAKLVQLNRSTDLAQMIGVWRGRQVEELLAQEVNKQLIQNLHEIYLEGRKAGRSNEFVNIARVSQTDDPILIEAARLIPNQTRAEIAQVFGPDEFWVRKDMLLDTFGARQASVGDLFTGQHRWDPKLTSQVQKIAAGMFGNKTYTMLVGAEKNIQEFVGNAKTLIVVKSVIVPVANVVSNMVQLLNRGVPVRHVLKGFRDKTAEINFYIKARNREIGLEADLRAATGSNDLVAMRKIGNQIQSLQDSYRRMSIWPLIEAGEFSAISSGQVTAEDLALADGKWTDFVERKVNELPDGLRTPARYAFLTRDTALFQGLARSVQYGDFVAKAILYDDLVRRKRKAKVEAVAAVNEAFVNYNRLAGRGRQYLESVGLMWFYNYKIRIMKEAAYMMRNNPLRSLMTVAAPALPLIGNIGTPIGDNAIALFNDGKLGYSIGPGMGLNSFGLNPWLNIVR